MVRHEGTGEVVCRRASRAHSFALRALGLMFRKGWGGERDGLLLDPCAAIHMFFMRMPIDVIFLDAQGCVVRAIGGLKPWRVAGGGVGCVMTLEVPAGTLLRVPVASGDRLRMEEER